MLKQSSVAAMNVSHRLRRASCEALDSRRLLNAGDLDPGFSADGKYSVDLPYGTGTATRPFQTVDVAIQVDGKVLLAGRRVDIAARAGGDSPEGGGSYLYGVVRLNVNGTIDTTFGGGDGFAEYDLMYIAGIDVDGTDGTIVICGDVYNASRQEQEFAIARLQPSGSPDPTFGGGDALVTMQFDGLLEGHSAANAIMIDRQHRILAVGTRLAGFLNFDTDFAMARLTTTGALDPSFDGDGKVVYSFGNWESATAVTIDYSGNPSTDPRYGQIVVAGVMDLDLDDFDHSRFAVARFNSTGQPDNTFDGDGAVTTVFETDGNSEAAGVVVQPGNRIVVTGTHKFGFNPADHNFMTVRYHVTGALDGAFGPNGTGYVETDTGGFENAGGIAINYLGGLLVGGAVGSDLVIAAYTFDGVLDTRFSGDGIHKFDVDSNYDTTGVLAITGSQIAPVRKIVIAGSDGSVARVVDVGSLISVGTLQPNMYEQGSVGTSFLVTRSQALPYAETIVLTTSGTATPRGANRDFNATGILFGNGTTTSTEVTIAAGATFTNVVLTPIDDLLGEGDETITFTVGTTLTYDAGFNRSTTLVLRDNDTVGGPVVIASSFQYDTYPQSADITFNQSVVTSFTIGDLVVTGPGPTPPAYSLNYNNVTNTGTVVFYNGLTNGDYTVRVKASGVTSVGGPPMAADYTFGFFFMMADANHDRAVNFSDLLILAQNYGESGKTFSQGNFSYSTDGKVDFDDLLILAQRYGTSLSKTVDITARPNRNRGNNADVLL